MDKPTTTRALEPSPSWYYVMCNSHYHHITNQNIGTNPTTQSGQCVRGFFGAYISALTRDEMHNKVDRMVGEKFADLAEQGQVVEALINVVETTTALMDQYVPDQFRNRPLSRVELFFLHGEENMVRMDPETMDGIDANTCGDDEADDSDIDEIGTTRTVKHKPTVQ